jgi:hypothetical protein
MSLRKCEKLSAKMIEKVAPSTMGRLPLRWAGTVVVINSSRTLKLYAG